MAAHTKAPWLVGRIGNTGLELVSADGLSIAVIGRRMPSTYESAGTEEAAAEQQANADLMSSAPDLADAVEALLLVTGEGAGAGHLCCDGLVPAEECCRCGRVLAALAALRKAGRR